MLTLLICNYHQALLGKNEVLFISRLDKCLILTYVVI